jgi:hypothetical protein
LGISDCGFEETLAANPQSSIRNPKSKKGYAVMERGRAIVALVLAAAGAGLLAYGLFHNSITVFSRSSSPPAVPALEGEPSPVQVAAQSEVVSEPAVTQEVARGGVTRDESGQIKKTYEGKQAPKACPT